MQRLPTLRQSTRFVRQFGIFCAELQTVRFAIRRPRNGQPKVAIRGTKPREVFCPAITLFRTAGRLHLQHEPERTAKPETPERLLSVVDKPNPRWIQQMVERS